MKENMELERSNIAVDRDMEVDCDTGHQITVYLETWFDVDKKFGVHTNDDPGTWVNMYGKYDPFEDMLRIECEIDRDDGMPNTYFDYEPTASEAALIKDMIAEKIRELYAQTPIEFCIDAYDEESARTLLKQKISDNFAVYKEKWMQMQPAQLIDICEELEAVTRMAETLPTAVSEEYAAYLLRFKNPLEVVSDEWISRNGTDALIVDDEMTHILWHIRDSGDAETVYELEPEFTESDSPTMSI